MKGALAPVCATPNQFLTRSDEGTKNTKNSPFRLSSCSSCLRPFELKRNFKNPHEPIQIIAPLVALTAIPPPAHASGSHLIKKVHGADLSARPVSHLSHRSFV